MSVRGPAGLDGRDARSIGIKVDVDTFRGMRKGVPVLLDIFKQYGIKASFFVPTGKDHTGWTIKRVFTRKGFLKKASRVGVIDTYGIKTLMYGLILPGPEIALGNASVMKRITEEGHEAGIHGHDHVYWHDHIKTMDMARTDAILTDSFSVYEKIMNTRPRSFAAPGWMINIHALAFFEREDIVYTSNTRGSFPFYPILNGRMFSVLEIPSTLPTLDEVVGIVGVHEAAMVDFFIGSLADGLNIMTIHTELEGNRWKGFLKNVIEKALDLGFSFRRLIDVAGDYGEPSLYPPCPIRFGAIAGRAGEVSIQDVEK